MQLLNSNLIYSINEMRHDEKSCPEAPWTGFCSPETASVHFFMQKTAMNLILETLDLNCPESLKDGPKFNQTRLLKRTEGGKMTIIQYIFSINKMHSLSSPPFLHKNALTTKKKDNLLFTICSLVVTNFCMNDFLFSPKTSQKTKHSK